MSVFLQRFGILSVDVGVGTDPYWDDVILLVGANGVDTSTDIPDESLLNSTLTCVGNAQLDTAFQMFGSASIILDGSGDYITIPRKAEFEFGADDFTIEFWFKRSGAPGAHAAWISKYETGSNRRQWNLMYNIDDNQVLLYVSTTGSDFPIAAFDCDIDGISEASLFDDTWHHIAGVRDGGTTKVYVDGNLGSVTWAGGATALYANTDIDTVIGGRNPATGVNQIFPACHMDEIRITAGVCRYTAPFTPPTEEFIRGLIPVIDYVTAYEMEVYTFLGAPQQAVGAKALEAYTIIGAPQTRVSAKSLEMYTIVEV